MSLQLRSTVARATRSVVPVWPLSSFIAVNPFSARESAPFDAVASTRSRDAYLADYRSARITDDDLVAAVEQRVPELAAAPPLTIGERTWSASAVVAAELVFGQHPFTGIGHAAGEMSQREDAVDVLAGTWIAAFCDPDPSWAVPHRELGFWAAWTAVAAHDPRIPRSARRHLRDLPAAPETAIDVALTRLGVADVQREAVLAREAERSHGWTAHIKWRAQHVQDIDLTSYLAMRLTLRAALGLSVCAVASTTFGEPTIWDRADHFLAEVSVPEMGTTEMGTTDMGTVVALRAPVAQLLAQHPVSLHGATWQTAYELHYRKGLLQSLSSEHAAPPPARTTVQVVMCIDARSEGMRRHLEAADDYETFGFAGFFGVPIRFARHDARGSIDALPALLAAKNFVTERPVDALRAQRHATALRFRDALVTARHAAERSSAAPFALAELAGLFSGAASILRTIAPAGTARIGEALRRATTPAMTSEVTIADAFTLGERASLAENAIRMMGLGRVADLVVLTGHGSTSTNNLYQSALDCGACGGNPGAANARAAASIFNDPEVRAILAERGLPIAPSSYFVAAEHNTVSDRISVLDQHLIPAEHRAAVDQFLARQSVAADLLVRERASQLPGGRITALARLRARAHDWAEVYPELGLAGNAAMIIGPRGMTRGIDLGRRVFLHSYDPALDPSSAALETIMTAPLVVAQWINHQYYFSTVEPDRWGAGTKTIHNAIGSVGVISGQGGDLRIGLPAQSVSLGDTLLHEPLRLAVFIEAPLDRIGEIVSRNQVLRNLLDNDWITLTARADNASPWHRYGAYGWNADTTATPQHATSQHATLQRAMNEGE
ncbi:MAG: DUF2309 domain-containing protein [Microbacteriaceae bacterium]